ncbi:MAG: hypothetical protein AAFU70_01540, partial [Planctomycetota bacterium]
VVAAGLAASAAAQTTVFGPGGTVGAGVPDAAVLNGLEAFTRFGEQNSADQPFGNTANSGETLFFAFGPLYVGGAGPASSNPLSSAGLSNLGAPVANNRAYGVIGEGRSDINFDPQSVISVTVQVRGTDSSQSAGGNPGNNFGGAQQLADANATLLIWTELGFQTSIQVANADFQEITVTASDFLSDNITRIALINEGPSNSAIVLGELTVVTDPNIPAPGAAAVLGLGGLAVARRRR